MKNLFISFLFLLLGYYAYSGGYKKVPVNKSYHKKQYHKPRFNPIRQKPFDCLIDVCTPNGYVIMLNTQNMTAQIDDLPYYEYEQIIDKSRPFTYCELSVEIYLAKWHR